MIFDGKAAVEETVLWCILVTFQVLSFGMVFGLCKLLKQSTVLVVKIARFGVNWLEFCQEVKVKHDQVLKLAIG